MLQFCNSQGVLLKSLRKNGNVNSLSRKKEHTEKKRCQLVRINVQ